jgi:hypothetical protein
VMEARPVKPIWQTKNRKIMTNQELIRLLKANSY